MDKKNYYDVMGLKKDASPQDIKLAYRRLARKYHPDLNKAADAEHHFKELGEAYEVLKDPKKRQMYDQMQAEPASRNTSHDYNGGAREAWSHWGDASPSNEGFDADIFESLFRNRAQRAGSDRYGELTVSLQEAFDGAVKELVFSSGGKKIRVNIPAGVKSGQQIRLSGLGEPGIKGGPKGDLYLTVTVKRDPVFDVIGNDVYVSLPITPWEAALGATVSVPTLAGAVDLKIPAHSQGGQKLRLKKRGLQPDGDQYVLLKIVIPHPKTDAETALYEAMAKEMPFNPRDKMEAHHG